MIEGFSFAICHLPSAIGDMHVDEHKIRMKFLPATSGILRVKLKELDPVFREALPNTKVNQ